MLISDELNHASIVDAMRLAKPDAQGRSTSTPTWTSSATALRACEPGQRKLVVTDGVFCMEGDLARLPDIVELAREHDAVVIVDDSHGDGRHGRDGPRRRGALRRARRDRRHHEHARQGARRRRRRLRRLERGGLRPARAALAAAALLERAPADGRLRRALAAVRVLRCAARARRRGSHANSRTFRERLARGRLQPLDGEAAIIPIIVGETAFAIELSERLLDEGVFVTGFGFPVVPEGTARVRVQMSAALEPEHLDRALAAFEKVGQRTPACSSRRGSRESGRSELTERRERLEAGLEEAKAFRARRSCAGRAPPRAARTPAAIDLCHIGQMLLRVHAAREREPHELEPVVGLVAVLAGDDAALHRAHAAGEVDRRRERLGGELLLRKVGEEALRVEEHARVPRRGRRSAHPPPRAGRRDTRAWPT